MPARSLFNSGGSGLQAASERKGFLKFLTVFGSVIPRCLLPSAIAAIEGAIAHRRAAQFFALARTSARPSEPHHHRRYGAEFFQDVWMHPYSLHVFGMVLGFSLVMRIQIAYQRFWEGATQCSQFASKWADAAMQIVCFDEASKDAFSDHALEFRLQILHYVSLMHAVALCDIRQDAEAVRGHGLTLQPEDPFVFRPSVQQAVLATSNRDVSPTPGRSSTGDLSADASAKGRGISHRHHTVPLAQLLRTRQTLRSRLAHAELDLNSFEAVRMEERIVSSDVATSWHDHPAPKPEKRSRMSLFGSPPRVDSPRGSQAGPGSEDSVKALTARAMHHDATQNDLFGGRAAAGPAAATGGAGKERVRKGSLTAGEYVAATVLLKSSKHTLEALMRANSFEVVGGVGDAEAAVLVKVPPADRCMLVQAWIVRLMTRRMLAGGLGIPPPILSRTYQVISDGTASYMQARKVSFIAFPFPLRQLLFVLLFVFQVLVPLCITSFMDELALVAVLSFFVCLGCDAERRDGT